MRCRENAGKLFATSNNHNIRRAPITCINAFYLCIYHFFFFHTNSQLSSVGRRRSDLIAPSTTTTPRVLFDTTVHRISSSNRPPVNHVRFGDTRGGRQDVSASPFVPFYFSRLNAYTYIHTDNYNHNITPARRRVFTRFFFLIIPTRVHAATNSRFRPVTFRSRVFTVTRPKRVRP